MMLQLFLGWVVRAALLLALLAMPYAQPLISTPSVEPAPLQRPWVLLPAAPADAVSLNATVQTSSNLGHTQIENGAFLTVIFTVSADVKLASATLDVTFTPYDALSNLHCNTCTILTTPVTVTTPSGDSYPTAIETGLQYTNATSSSSSFSFTAQLLGQPDGRILKINAVLSYVNSNGVGSEAHKMMELTVRAPTQDNGQAQVLPYPSWRSPDIAGVFSQDWGDYDRDGDPDLALGFARGARVYQNDHGLLTPVFTSSLNIANNSSGTVYAVRWADVIPGGSLELLEGGGSGSSDGGFLNVYTIGNSTPISFTSPYTLAHLAIANFVGNGELDVVANNATFSIDCPLMIFTDTKTNGGCYQGPLNPTVALGVVNIDNKPYLAASGFNKPIKLYKFADSAFTEAYTIPSAVNSDQFNFPPYDFAWGDFDHNGIPDLAAAFPLQHEVRIYKGTGTPANPTWSLTPTIPVDGFFAPLSVDWADVDGDGYLDLLVAGSPPSVYRYNDTDKSFTKIDPPKDAPSLYDPQGQIWSLRAAHMQPSFDPSFLATNIYQPSWLYDIVQPRLSATLEQTVTGSFHSIALGDVYADNHLDMVFGSEVSSTIVMSIAGNRYSIPNAGNGPQDVALGDVNGNGTPDVAVGASGLAGIYGGGSTTRVFTQTGLGKMVLALGDADGDNILDVASGNMDGGPAQVFTHTGIMTAKPLFTPTPAWTAPVATGVRALAWADVDRDFYPDLLVVDGGGMAARLYRNSGNQTNANAMLSLTWQHDTHDKAQPISAVAWGDVNGDGRPDLAVAEGNHIYVFESDAALRSLLPSPSLTLTLSSTSVISGMAWGDWNNDGLPELAVADAKGPVRVYANLNSKPGQLRLEWLWQATGAATGVAWGDMNNDGYLDLGVSRKSDNSGISGIYINTTLKGARAIAPPQIEVHRPGITRDAGNFSSSEVLGGRFSPNVTLQLTATRQGAITNTQVIPKYEFTRDGGKTWLPAAVTENQAFTPVGASTNVAKLTWDLRNAANTVAGIDVRFRASLTATDATGQPDAVAGRAVSPPFQAQGSLCDWPTYLSISGSPTVVVNTAPIFTATVGRNQDGNGGSMAFTWNFGDGQPEKSAQWLSVNYTLTNEYTLTVSAQAQNCGDVPARKATAYLRVKAIKPAMSAMSVLSAMPQAAQTLDAPAPDLLQVQGLNGQSDVARIHLTWQPVNGDGGRYHVYRGKDGQLPALLAELPESQTSYAAELACGAYYYVANVRGGVESLPSTTSYYAPDCANTAALAQMQPQPISRGAVSAADLPPSLAEPETTDSAASLAAQSSFGAGSAWVAGTVLPKAFLPLVFKNNLPTEGPRGQCSVSVTTAIPVRSAQIGNLDVVYTDSVILDPVMSSDGGSVAFTSNVDNGNSDTNLEIFAKRGVTTTAVTSSTGNIFGGYNLGASISGDGTRIAFFSDRLYPCTGCDSGKGGFNNFEIFVAQGVTSTGTLAFTYTQVTSTSIASNVSPAISADGRWVVFVSNAITPNLPCTYCNNPNGNSQVYLAQLGVAAGGDVTITQLTNNSSRSVTYDFPVVSSGGSTVAYVSTKDGISTLLAGPPCSASLVGDSQRERPYITSNGRIVVYTTAEGQIISNTLPISNLTGSTPAISDDGTRLVYVNAGKAQLVQLSASSNDPQDLGTARYVGISADGKGVMTATEKAIRVAGLTDLQVSVISSTTVAGSDYMQMVMITNTGIVAANGVKVIPSFNRDAKAIFDRNGTWDCLPSDFSVDEKSPVTVTCTGKIRSDFQGDFVTTITVTTLTPEANETNNTQSIATTVIRQANLKITINAPSNNSSVNAGETIVYNITLTNTGPSDADAVVLTSLLTGDASLISSVDSNCPNPDKSDKKITCTFHQMTANEHPTIQFTVKAGAKGAIVNTIDATSTNPTANAKQETVTTAIYPAKLTIAHTVAPAEVRAGGQVVFTIKVQNDGPGIAQNVQVNSALSTQASATLGSIIAQPLTMCDGSTVATVTNSGFSATITQLEAGVLNAKTFKLCARVKDNTPAPTTLYSDVSVSADTADDVKINPPQTSVQIAVTSITGVSIVCTVDNNTPCSDTDKIKGKSLVFKANLEPANATTPKKYEWSLISGTTTIKLSNDQTLGYTFTEVGLYQVKLKLTGADDKSYEPTQTVIIASPPTPAPSPIPKPPPPPPP